MLSQNKKNSMFYADYRKRLMPGYLAMIAVLVFTLLVALVMLLGWEAAKQENRNYNRTLSYRISREHQQYTDAISSLADEPTVLRAAKGQGTAGAVAALRSASRNLNIPCNYVLLNAQREIVYTNLFSVNHERCLNSIDTILILGRLSEDPHTIFEGINRAGYSSGQESIYHFGTAVLDGDEIAGYLILDVRQRPIDVLLLNGPSEVVAIDRQQNIIYTTLNSSNFYIDNYRRIKWNSDFTIPDKIMVNGVKYYATRTSRETFLEGKMSLMTLTPDGVFQRRFQMLFTNISLVFMLLVIAVLLLTDKTARKGMQALDNIFESVKKWDQGNIQYRLPEPEDAELQRVCRGINAIMDKAELLINHNADLTAINYRMELSNMEAQFNPHFVFNVLETIKCMTMINPEKAGEMIVSFAKLLRYSINYGTDIVNTRKDLDYIEAYLQLQKERLGDRLKYAIEIEDDLLNLKIPKLILQPLVENAIVHNIDHVRHIKVDIKGYIDGQDMVFVVSDNGRGLSEEALQAIREKMRMGASIGLHHVDRTLRLRYGERYGLGIRSNVGEGLQATVRIPLGEGAK